MSTVTPSRPPPPTGSIDPAELEAYVEALIEEARLRARRRRRRNGAYAFLALLLGGGLYFGVGRSGHGASAPAAPSPEVRAGLSRGRVGAWIPTNGPDGGPAYAVAIAPSAPDVVYAGTEHGIFRSANAGLTWTSAGLGGPPVNSLASPPSLPGVTAVVVDPASADTVFAGRNGTWGGGRNYSRPVVKSTDGGRTWHTLAVRGQPVAVVRTTPETVFAATGGLQDATSRLLRSTNGGRTWRPSDTGLPRTYLWSLASDPGRPQHLYAAMGAHGLYESGDGGAHWRALRIGTAHDPVTAVAVAPTSPYAIVAALDTGVVASLDGGSSWHLLNAAMAGHDRDRGYRQVTSLLFASHDSRTLYATTTCAGVFKTTSGGRRWRPVNAGLAPKCPFSYAVAVDPRDTGTLYAAERQRGMLKSVDGGARWQLTNAGLGISSVTSVVVDPARPRTLYAAARGLGLFESSDAGAHWRPLRTGLTRVDVVAVDPGDPQHVLAAGLGLALSEDGGRTWSRAAFGSHDVADVVVDGQTAVAAIGSGILKSADGGRTWHALAAPHFFSEVLAVAPDDPATVYAGGGGWGFAATGGLYRSADGGATWQRLTDALKVDVSAIAVDPRSPSTIYIGTPGAEGGIFESVDSGTTWRRQDASPRWRTVSRGGKPIAPTLGITSLVVDPAQPRTLYAATGWDGVFRSTDGARSWRRFDAGLTDEAVTSLALDPTGGELYGGTEAGGVVSVRTR